MKSFNQMLIEINEGSTHSALSADTGAWQGPLLRQLITLGAVVHAARPTVGEWHDG